MPAGLVLEFDGVTREHYDAVNAALGLDPATGGGDWPAGLLFHTGGAIEGGWTVIEVWDSQATQASWMEGRLGAALGEVGVPAPVRATWSEVGALYTP